VKTGVQAVNKQLKLPESSLLRRSGPGHPLGRAESSLLRHSGPDPESSLLHPGCPIGAALLPDFTLPAFTGISLPRQVLTRGKGHQADFFTTSHHLLSLLSSFLRGLRLIREFACLLFPVLVRFRQGILHSDFSTSRLLAVFVEILCHDRHGWEEKYYSHSLLNEPPEKWQGLGDHLKNVAEMAQGFAEEFGAGEWGYLAGLWHDLGRLNG
jgi:hypothetical protein